MQRNTDIPRKTALITGATSGIGEALMQELLASNTEVYAIVSPHSAQHASVLKRYAVNVYPIDLGDLSQVASQIGKLYKRLSSIDFLVHVAGVYHYGEKVYSDIKFEDYQMDELSNIINVGYTSFTVITHKLLPKLTSGARIIGISGTFSSAQGWLPYYMSKKNLESFIIGLADELKARNITANCISPGDTITPSYQRFFPEYATEEYAITPADIGAIFKFLLSEPARYVTRQVITVRK